jgi:transposase-like protein
VKLTLKEINKLVETEADAYLLLEQLRWADGPVCPHCGNKKAYFLKPSNGVSRATGPKKTMSQRRVWKCAKCRKQFSVLTGTIFHGTKIDIRTWLMVMVQMCSAKNGISAREVERMHGLPPETAWYMLHRLRESMKRDPLASRLSGTIVSDETWIGGKPSNRHHHKADESKKGYGTDKTPIVSLVNAETGEVRSVVVTNVDSSTLRRAMETAGVDMAHSTLWTDESRMYTNLGRRFMAHESVNHGKGQYVNPKGAGTNRAEGYFAQLKRSINGTHHHVSKEHLARYVAEFDFRYSTCKMQDSERLQSMVDQSAGRRLTYRPLTGK